jgi:hypothetical protein
MTSRAFDREGRGPSVSAVRFMSNNTASSRKSSIPGKVTPRSAFETVSTLHPACAARSSCVNFFALRAERRAAATRSRRFFGVDMEPECLPARQHSMDIITVYFKNPHLCTSSANRGRFVMHLAKRRNYRIFGALPSCLVPQRSELAVKLDGISMQPIATLGVPMLTMPFSRGAFCFSIAEFSRVLASREPAWL